MMISTEKARASADSQRKALDFSRATAESTVQIAEGKFKMPDNTNHVYLAPCRHCGEQPRILKPSWRVGHACLVLDKEIRMSISEWNSINASHTARLKDLRDENMLSYEILDSQRGTLFVITLDDGHVHENVDEVGFAAWPIVRTHKRSLNCGVDVNGFAPVTFDELVQNNERWRKEHP